MMQKLCLSALMATVALPAFAKTTVELSYSHGYLYEATLTQIEELFEAANPDIDLVIRTPSTDYNEGMQKLLQETITGRSPDVVLVGLDNQRMLVEREIARPLDQFIAKESDFSAEGYHKAMLDLSRFQDQVYGLPFAVSTPIGYYNMDILAKAGWGDRELPKTWDEVIELCQMIQTTQPEVDTMFWSWMFGGWFWQAMNWANNNTMLTPDESKVNFDNELGLQAMRTYADLVEKCDMPNIDWKESLVNFSGGRQGMQFYSAASLQTIANDSAGSFNLVTAPFPGVSEGGGVPAGGAAMMVIAQDDAQAEAAWKFVKFATSGEGAALVAVNTGYVPPNQAANEILGDFYKENPNKLTAAAQLPIVREWYGFPGDNALKITKAIDNAMQSIASRERIHEPDAVVKDLAAEVQSLLPKK